MEIVNLLVTLIAIIITVYLILIKKINPTSVFFIVGILLMFYLVLFQGYSPLEESTGNVFLDIFASIGTEFKDQLSGAATNIILVSGFATLMIESGSSGKLAVLATKPLMVLNKPYVVVSGIIIVSFILKMMITSQAGLTLLLLATVYPIMLSLGVSPATAAGAVVISGALDWGTNDGAVIYAAQELSGISVGEYFLENQLLIAVIVILTIAIVYPIHNSRLDKKEKINDASIGVDLTLGDQDSINDYWDVPSYYAIFPTLPLLIVLGFYFVPNIEMDVFTANVLGIILFLIVRGINYGVGQSIEDLQTLFKGMGNAFASLITLIVAASIFASALASAGGIELLANWISNLSGANIIAIVLLVIISYMIVTVLGSANAAIYGFGPVVVDIAPKVGLTAIELAIPVQMAASMGRAISPLISAMIAISSEMIPVPGLSDLQVADVVKRTAIPSFCGLIALIISSIIFL